MDENEYTEFVECGIWTGLSAFERALCTSFFHPFFNSLKQIAAIFEFRKETKKNEHT